MKSETGKTGISRRTVLKGGAAIAGAAIGSGAITGFPTIWAQNIKDVTLRQFGTGVSNLNEIAAKVKEDLGITLEMTALDSDAVTQRAATQPNSFDIADIEYWICKKVLPSGNLQAMDVKKIKNYDKIVRIFTNGKLTPDTVIAQGTAPHTVGFVESANGTTFAKDETGFMTLIPTVYNADTLGIRPDLIKRPIASWTELLEPRVQGQGLDPQHPLDRHHGRAMVCEAMGDIKYADKGNMTKEEIDMTIRS